MACCSLCKQAQSQWTRRNNFARTKRACRGQIGVGNITIHDRKRQRYRRKICKQTFGARFGILFEGLRKPGELEIINADIVLER